jgi:nicotinamidase/pyrazinamidase
MGDIEMKIERDWALLIVDVQNDFCPGGALEVEHGDEIIPVINTMSNHFPLVVATKDWHPRGHVSFASSYPGKEAGEVIEAGGLQQVLWPEHCIAESNGAAFHPELDTRPVDMIQHKGLKKDLDSYSAFFENDKSTPTGLEGYLKGLNISTLVVSGLATDVCVYFTALDGVRTGFMVYLLEDAVRGVDIPAGNLQSALDDMKDKGVVFISSTDLE